MKSVIFAETKPTVLVYDPDDTESFAGGSTLFEKQDTTLYLMNAQVVTVALVVFGFLAKHYGIIDDSAFNIVVLTSAGCTFLTLVFYHYHRFSSDIGESRLIPTTPGGGSSRTLTSQPQQVVMASYKKGAAFYLVNLQVISLACILFAVIARHYNIIPDKTYTILLIAGPSWVALTVIFYHIHRNREKERPMLNIENDDPVSAGTPPPLPQAERLARVARIRQLTLTSGRQELSQAIQNNGGASGSQTQSGNALNSPYAHRKSSEPLNPTGSQEQVDPDDTQFAEGADEGDVPSLQVTEPEEDDVIRVEEEPDSPPRKLTLSQAALLTETTAPSDDQ